MPEMTGIEFFKKMEKDHPSISKIILTGYLEDQAVADAIKKGSVDKSVIKPWDDEDILNTVSEMLNNPPTI